MLDGGKLLSGVFSEIQQEMSMLARYMLNLETSVMDTVPRNIRGKCKKKEQKIMLDNTMVIMVII